MAQDPVRGLSVRIDDDPIAVARDQQRQLDGLIAQVAALNARVTELEAKAN